MFPSMCWDIAFPVTMSWESPIPKSHFNRLTFFPAVILHGLKENHSLRYGCLN